MDQVLRDVKAAFSSLGVANAKLEMALETIAARAKSSSKTITRGGMEHRAKEFHSAIGMRFSKNAFVHFGESDMKFSENFIYNFDIKGNVIMLLFCFKCFYLRYGLNVGGTKTSPEELVTLNDRELFANTHAEYKRIVAHSFYNLKLLLFGPTTAQRILMVAATNKAAAKKAAAKKAGAAAQKAAGDSAEKTKQKRGPNEGPAPAKRGRTEGAEPAAETAPPPDTALNETSTVPKKRTAEELAQEVRELLTWNEFEGEEQVRPDTYPILIRNNNFACS